MEQTTKYCPCCGRHCDLSAPHCGRGEEYARTGVIPEGHQHHGASAQDRPFDHDRHPEQEGRPHHRGGKKLMERGHYKELDTDDKLLILLRELGGLGRHGFNGKGSQTRILSILEKEGTMTQRDLTDRLGIQPGSASEVLGKLEAAGLILRSPSDTDRRTTNVSLTEVGKGKAAEGGEPRQNVLFSDLTEAEKETLLALLEKLCTAWEQKAGEHHGHHHGPHHGHHGKDRHREPR